MSEVTYIFGDALTGDIIEEIRLTSVSIKQSLSSGEFRGTFQLDQTGKDNDTLVTATTPGRTFCIVERDGVPIGDFIIWTRTYQSQAKVAELYGTSWKDYTESRIITSSYSANDVEQTTIMLDLYTLMQSANNSLRITLPQTLNTGITKSISVSGSEYKTYRQVMDSIADTSDGFDWLVSIRKDSNDRYERFLAMGYPEIGARNTNHAMPVFEYIHTQEGPGGNITNYWANDSMGSAATNFYGIGSGEGAAMLVSNFVHFDLLSSGFPRYDSTYDRKDVNEQVILNGLTAQQGTIYKAPLCTITAEVRANTDPEFGSYGVGDACKIVINDTRFPNTLQKVTRILGYEYYPPEDSNIEMVRLIFEGDPNG